MTEKELRKPAIKLNNVSFSYQNIKALNELSLQVPTGMSFGLLGPNGAGKSTILHSIYGFTNIFSGQIEIDGKEITNLTPADKLKSVGIA
ncbi:MAG: ATP-binding cassette domain-containing protein, partial [Dehalococcoidales bacterium]|nr:ATP-binding cassette domain-containing protein [Dehalococcoidales bacterium]